MTQDEIIDKLLFQAGAHFGGDGINYEEFDFRKFAKLVAAKAIAELESQEPAACERFQDELEQRYKEINQ